MSGKGITLNDLLGKDERAIKEGFIHGAREATPGRFVPADEGQATKTLAELLKAKEDRLERPRYMRQSYSVPSKYVRNPNASGGENDNYTHSPGKAVKGPQGAEIVVPEDVQKEFTARANANDLVRKAGEHERRLRQPKSLEQQITEAVEIAKEQGVDVHADLQFIRRRVARMVEKLQRAS